MLPTVPTTINELHSKAGLSTCGMERSISISELSAENGVAVKNAYGSIIGDNEDHADDSAVRFVDICTSPRWKYPLFGLEFEKLI